MNGVRPVTVRMMIAMTTSGTARRTAKTPRRGRRSHSGPTPWAAGMPRMVESTTPSTPPTQAIVTDTQVW